MKQDSTVKELDVVDATLNYDGFESKVTGGWDGSPFTSKFVVKGSEGTLKFDIGRGTTYSSGKAQSTIGVVGQCGWIEQLIDGCRWISAEPSERKPLRCTLVDALQTSMLVEATAISAAADGDPVEVDIA